MMELFKNIPCTRSISGAARIATGCKVYLVPARGEIEVNGVVVATGDGVAIRGEWLLQLSAQEDSEIVLVDVA